MFIAGVIISFAVYLSIGFFVSRKVKTASDYYVADRQAPTILVAGSLVASFLSTVSFMGEFGFSYSGYPILLLILVVFNVSGYVLGVLLFGRYLRRSRVLTVPEFFGQRFQSKPLQCVMGLTVVVGVGIYLIAVTQGVGLVLANLFGVPKWAGMVIIWAVYASFTILAGSPGVLITDTIMFLIFTTGGVIGLSWLIAEAGGPTHMMTTLMSQHIKPGLLSWHGLAGPDAAFGPPAAALAWAIILGFVWGAVVAVSPWQTSRYLMARSEHICLRAGLVAMITILGLYIFLTLGAAAINVFNSNIQPTDIAFIWAAQNVLPKPLGVLVVAGIFAAGLSSASTFLSLTGFSATNDVVPALAQRSDETRVRVARLVMLAVSVIVLLVTLTAPPAVFAIGYFAATLFAASWGPAAILAIYSERVTNRGVLLGVTSSFIIVSILKGLEEFTGLSIPVWIHPVIIGVIVNLLVTAFGSMMQSATLSEIEFRQQLFITPEKETEPDSVRLTLRYTMVAALASVGLIILLYFLYYEPFTAAITITS